MIYRLVLLLSAISFLAACGGGGGGGVQPTTYPKVSLSTSTSSLAENSGTTVTLTVTASKTSNEDITVTLSTSGTATDGTDYSAVNGSSLTISAGTTTATKTFTITDNSIYEGNETVVVAISTVSGGSATENGTQSETITITDNESAPAITLATSHTTVAENSGTTITLTATSSQVADEDVTVTLASSGVATNGTDYSSLGGQTITISAGSTTGTITGTPTDDSIYEGDEVATIAISTVSGANASESGSQSVSITITENESAPTITLVASASSVAENSGTTITLTATASQVADEDITVTLTSSGTATNGTDYSSLGGQTITISAGSTSGTITGTPTDDSVYEDDEIATISISGVSGGGSTEYGTQSVSITITENDSTPIITMSVSEASVAENSGTEVTLTLTTSQIADEDIVVSLSASGTISSSDYVSTSLSPSTVTISAGSTTGTVSATASDDSIYEGNESSTVSISSISGANATESGAQSITFTIVENESAPVITLTASHTTVAENSGTTITLTATSSQAADEAITVTLASTGTATNGTDYSSFDGQTITISANSTTGTITGTPTDDSVYEGDEVAIISISNVSGIDATESGSQSVSITITDNESAPVITLGTSDTTTVAENASSSDDIVLTATSSVAADEDITVTLSTSGTATDGTDYSIDGGANVGGQTITISSGSTSGNLTALGPIGDTTALYEGDETAVIAISSVSGSDASESSTPQSVTITITEEQSAPTITLTSSASSVYDDGSNLTLTATSSVAADEDITVTLATSGAATEGSDYASLSDITISSGVTTGTAAFNPTSETVNEGAETATIAIDTVSGADASESGTQSVTITINEYALRTGTTFTEGTASEQLIIRSASNWTNLEGSSSTGTVHPYELMNIDKVHSFTDGTNNLTGVGQVIHIADFNCDDSHEIYNNKTIYNLDNGGAGESTFGAATSSSSHCQFVANMAAGDSNADVVGVAPDADLVLSSIPNTGGTYSSDDYARDLDSARGYGAVVSNNSWVYGDATDGNANANYNVTELQAFIANNPSYTVNQLFAYRTENSTSDEAVAASQLYITALDDFQNTGVVVFANGNYNGESDASFMAGLPEFYSQLGEAWISVNLSDFTGSSLGSATESDFNLLGNKCGSTQEYCLTVDDWLLKGASYVSGGVSQYNDNGAGSSYGAPMVSGGIALLSQAFPNHTPEQITDRLLASANNSWFTAEGSTTFTTHGNSITHGYHSTWGQGVPDFYAALSPITTNANPAMALYTGSSIQEGVSSGSSVSLASSSITPSASFGDAISQGLSGEVGYAYDALSGGFKYDMTTRIDTSNNDVPTISLSSEMAKLDSLLAANNPSWKNNFSQVLSQLSKTDKLETSLTVGASSLPVQSFFGSNFDSSISLNDYETPYLESGEGGIGLGATYQLGGSRLLVGMTSPINQGNDNTIGLRKSLVASLEYGKPTDTAMTFMAGITQDEDSLLGSTGNDAYSLSGAKSNTTFTAFKAQTQLGKDLSLTGVATLANTNMTSPDNSFINSASNVKSTSISLVANQKNIFGDDAVSLFVSQPNRVNDGDMSIRLSNLADSNGNLTYHNKDINLEPTARQLDYGLTYRKDFDKDISFSVKHMMTENLNHKQDSKTASSSFIGVKYQNLKAGLTTGSDENSRSAEMLYKFKF